MTKDVIELAREAGMNPNADKGAVNALGSSVPLSLLGHFAALVAARERERVTSAAMESASKAIGAAVAMTIERCARVCESMHEEDRPGDYAYAIRALNTEGPGATTAQKGKSK